MIKSQKKTYLDLLFLFKLLLKLHFLTVLFLDQFRMKTSCPSRNYIYLPLQQNAFSFVLVISFPLNYQHERNMGKLLLTLRKRISGLFDFVEKSSELMAGNKSADKAFVIGSILDILQTLLVSGKNKIPSEMVALVKKSCFLPKHCSVKIQSRC